MGLVYLAFGLWLIRGEQLIVIALIAGFVLSIILRIVRWLFKQSNGWLVPVIGVLMAVTITFAVLIDTFRDRLAPALFIAAAISFLIYGLCISAPTHHPASSDNS
jgi:uncharacterized membrane protein HdeD (DUF308 family)